MAVEAAVSAELKGAGAGARPSRSPEDDVRKWKVLKS